MDDPVATPRARLRAAHRCLAGHDPRRHGRHHATQKRPSVIFQTDSNDVADLQYLGFAELLAFYNAAVNFTPTGR